MSHLANYLDATDRSIEAWLKGARTPMKQEGLANNTIVMMSSDNKEW